MRQFLNSTTTRTKGWQADCWNWASANQPFELHGVGHEHLPFCQELSDACHCHYRSQQFRQEAVAFFEPSRKTDCLEIQFPR